MTGSCFFNLVVIAGGLGLFLHGLEFTARAFRKSLGSGVRRVMAKLSRHKGLSFFFGVLLSFLSQSSTAATSFAVGLVDAGILPFACSLVVMMGASVGTTFVVLLLSLDIVRYSPLLLLLSVVMSRSGQDRVMKVGYVIQGISLVLLGMLLVNQGVLPLSSEPLFRSVLLQGAGNPWILALAAFLITSLVQSSVPVIALTIALTSAGLFPLQSVLPLVLGTHVGSSTTVLLAGFGARRNARILAVSTFYYKLVGALLIFPAGGLVLKGVQALSGTPGRQVAYIQVFVAWFNALILLPISGHLANWSQRFFARGREESVGDPLYLDPRSVPLTSLAIRLLSKEMIRLAIHLEELIFLCLRTDCRDEAERVKVLGAGTRQLVQVCMDYLVSIPAPMEPDDLGREYTSISYSMAAMRDLVEVTSRRLVPLCLKTRCSPGPFQASPAEWQSFMAKLQDLVRNSLSVLALGGGEMIPRTLTSFNVFTEAESKMRSVLVSRGFFLDSQAEIDAWDFLSAANGLARASVELARGGALDECNKISVEGNALGERKQEGGVIDAF